MAQLFSPASNTIATATVIVGALGLTVVVLTGSQMTRSYQQKVNVGIEQPIPFSHKHHSKELGIDCRYCHTSVEESTFAGIPPTEACMSCHSQVWTNSPLLQPLRDSYRTGKPLQWNRVFDLPDFVYFNHSIHIKKGIGCNECHGQVNEMQITYKPKPFFMMWCLECHRNPEKYIRPREEVFNSDYKHPSNQLGMGAKLVKDYKINKAQLLDCSVCHR